MKYLSGKAQVDINILNVGEAIPSCCAVSLFPLLRMSTVKSWTAFRMLNRRLRSSRPRQTQRPEVIDQYIRCLAALYRTMHIVIPLHPLKQY